MKLYTRCTTILFATLFCSTVILGAFSYVGASGNDDKSRVAIKEKIFCYLKERKVSSNDEKLRKLANSVYEEAKDFEIDYRLVRSHES